MSIMNPAYTVYNLLGRFLFLGLFPGFRIYSSLSNRKNESMRQRFGLYPGNLVSQVSGSPRIWIHAASVGEVTVASAITDALMGLIPDCAIISSTTTRHGQTYLRAKHLPQTTCVYAPIDFPPTVYRSLKTFKPDILVCLETEIWPNWLITASKMRIKTAIVNGRISIRSIEKYLKIRPIIKEALVHIHGFSMIAETDALRIKTLGAPEDRIVVNGNAKYDLLLAQADMSQKDIIQSKFCIREGEPVFIAGSTRGSEEEIVLGAYQKILQVIPKTVLILAPRHISRIPQIETLIKKKGFEYQLKTDLDHKDARRTAPVVIIDTMGDLQTIYSVATVVFCGGSLVPLGGHNVLEPAVWGKPVLYGTSMEDFLDAKALLEKTGGGIQIKDGSDLADKVIYYLSHPALSQKTGHLARKALMANVGAAKKHALFICQLLSPSIRKFDKVWN